MTTITTNQGHTIRVQHGDDRVTLTATDAQAVAILHLTSAQAQALAEALTGGPEVQRMIAEAEVGIVDRYEMAIRRRFFGVKGFEWPVQDARDEAIAAIRAEAAAIKGEAE